MMVTVIQILFEPKYNIGDVVKLKISTDDKMVISGYSIKQVNQACEVTFFRYVMYNEKGEEYYYSEHDLELVESNKIL